MKMKTMKTNYKYILALGLVIGLALPGMADAGAASSSQITLSTVIYVFAFILLLIGIAVFRIAIHLSKYMRGEFAEDRKPERSFWERVFQLKPVSSDKDTLINEPHDGIYELDNPPPPWFMFLFYFTIVFAVVYTFRFVFTDMGYTQLDEYEAEVAEAQEAEKAFLASNPDQLNEETVELKLDEATIATGMTVYNDYGCNACHGLQGEGGIGPAFVDEKYIHGCDISSIFKSVKYGYLEKGMQAWNGMLSPEEMEAVSSYIISLRGTEVPAGVEVKIKDTEVPCDAGGAEETPTEAVDSTLQASL
jgi:cytochrome c oxidase cbb3-type subunit 3